MPRQARVAVKDVVYHVINRANGRAQIFEKDADYQHFESLEIMGRGIINSTLP